MISIHLRYAGNPVPRIRACRDWAKARSVARAEQSEGARIALITDGSTFLRGKQIAELLAMR